MPFSFLGANILKDLCLTAAGNMPCQWYANLEGWRSHECERGTQECVCHNDFNNLRGLTRNYMTLRTHECVPRRHSCRRPVVLHRPANNVSPLKCLWHQKLS